MTGDPSVQITELGAPRVGDPVDPNSEAMGAPTPPPWAPPAPAPPTEPARRRWRFGPRSLTARLVTGVVTLVVIVVVASGMGTYFALKSFLVNRLDQQLAPTVSGTVGTAAQCLIALDTSPTAKCTLGGGRFHNPQREWLTIVEASGQSMAPRLVPAPDDNFTVLSLSPPALVRVTRNPEANFTVRTTDGSSVRVAARALPTGGFVIVGLSTSEVDRTLHRLIALEWIIGGVAVVVAAFATYGGVRFSLRQLHRVTATAQEVAAELSPEGAGLDRRVPVDETGTEVGQLAESMNTLLAAVETQFAARLESEYRMRQFLADASHELRTPLTSIRGYAELARMQRDYGDATAAPANLDRIEAEGTRMSRLIDDLLLLARSDQPRDTEPVRELLDVDALLDDVVSGVRAAYPERDVRVAAAPDLTLVGDPDQLVRAIRNLVTNAAIHTRPDGPIGVSAHREADVVVIQVADSGPGLPPEQAAHVFERFWRADKARTRARGGSGLGMAIVASIVQAHGGTVRFDSSVATGSTVTIRLPAGLA